MVIGGEVRCERLGAAGMPDPQHMHALNPEAVLTGHQCVNMVFPRMPNWRTAWPPCVVFFWEPPYMAAAAPPCVPAQSSTVAFMQRMPPYDPAWDQKVSERSVLEIGMAKVGCKDWHFPYILPA